MSIRLTELPGGNIPAAAILFRLWLAKGCAQLALISNCLLETIFSIAAISSGVAELLVDEHAKLVSNNIKIPMFSKGFIVLNISNLQVTKYISQIEVNNEVLTFKAFKDGQGLFGIDEIHPR